MNNTYVQSVNSCKSSRFTSIMQFSQSKGSIRLVDTHKSEHGRNIPSYTHQAGSNLLDSFHHNATKSVTLLRDQPVISGNLTGDNLKKCKSVVVKTQQKSTNLSDKNRTARSSAVKRITEVIRSDRAESLSAGSLHLSRLNLAER